MAHRLRRVRRHNHPVFPRDLHERGHRVEIAEIEPLRVRVQFPDPAESRIGASPRLAHGIRAPRGIHARHTDEPSGILPHRLYQIVVRRARQLDVRPPDTHDHRNVHAVLIHPPDQPLRRRHPRLRACEKFPERGVPRQILLTPRPKPGRIDMSVKVDNHGASSSGADGFSYHCNGFSERRR